MKKTVNANIAGFVFHVEEGAFETLQKYLKAIEKYFKDGDERKEIMKDIESRIAELFQDRTQNSKEVVTENDVTEVIIIMGEPSDYVSEGYEEDKNEEAANSFSDTHDSSEDERVEKRIFRDPDNSQIGGVCSGLAAYFGVDPVVMRIIFVVLVLFGLSGVLIYIVLLLIIPEAKTVNDKLKMRGEPINVDSIKNAADEVKMAFSRATKKKGGSTINKSVEKGISVASSFAKILSKFIGVGFLVGGVFALVFLISVIIGDGGLVPFWGDRHSLNLNDASNMLFGGSFQSLLFYTSILVVIFIPIICILYIGIKLIFEVKAKLKYIAITLTVLWTIAVASLFLCGANLGVEFREEAEISQDFEILNHNQIKVNITNDDVFSNKIEYSRHWNNSDLIDVDGSQIFLGYPTLKIIESDVDSTFKIEVLKYSRGLNQREAIINSEAITYDVSIFNNQVNLAPYMVLNDQEYRGQNVEILIRVPEGKTILLGENIERILKPIAATNVERNKRFIFSNTEWTNEGNQMKFVD